MTPLQSLLLDGNVTRQIESVPLHTPGPDLLLQSFAVAAVAKTATKVCNESFMMERFGRLLFFGGFENDGKVECWHEKTPTRKCLGSPEVQHFIITKLSTLGKMPRSLKYATL